MNIHTFASHIRRYIDSKPFIAALIALVTLLVIIAIFEAGVLFGMHEARHSYRWGENYERNFGGPAGGFFPRPGMSPDGHGAFGRVASTSPSGFVLTDPSHPEERIELHDDVIIRNGNAVASSSALTVGTYVVVIGTPNDTGAIDAKLIRIMPAPPEGMSLPPRP